VTDQGAGIEPTRQEDVFGAFCRLHRNDEIPGHGLGLAICRKVVEQHGGTIGLESEVGAGTTVWFTLPG
jgi:signal transduction histidine kinase